MSRAEKARNTMAERKGNCAQSVFIAFAEEMGLDKTAALSVAQGFGGGMAHTGGTCGAVTGAYMVLGLANPPSKENPREKIESTYALIGEFNKKFRAKHGSLNCTELAGFDLSKPEEMTKAREKGVFTTICPNCVGDAVEILEELLKLS